jgi:signal transduction histidine kinase
VAISESRVAPVRHREASDHEEQAVGELGRRSRSGTAFHFAGLVFIELYMPGADPLPRGVTVTIFLGFLIVRLVGLRMTMRHVGSVRQRLVVLSIGAIGTSLVWSVRAVAVQLHAGSTEPSFLIMVILAAFATGSMTAFAPNLTLQRSALSALLVPMVIVSLAYRGPTPLVVLHGLFYAYMLAQGSVAHRSYWQSLRATESLRRHAESAQLAAVAADAVNLRLRTEIAHGAMMEVELRQAQKLEAIGRLAAGIAHEINTPVQFVSDSCQFLGEGVAQLTDGMNDYRRIATELADGRLTAPDAAAQAARVEQDNDLPYLRDNLPGAVARALDGLGRVARIVAATKEFAYPHVRDKAIANINKAIESTLIISNNETKYVANVVAELGEVPAIMCHCGELNQVVLNIIVNAAHAIRDVVKDTGAKGVIHIKTWADPGWVRISISDTGTGIPAEILDKIYEPFFTTKPVGMGTGQGLAIARSAIVDKHGGTIDVRSQLGVGTTFTISLPTT